MNPFAYLKRHNKPTPFATETAYNKAIVDTCLDEKIEAIGVTDHYRIGESRALIEDATAASLTVFPGFEAVSKEGVHFLCLFDPRTDLHIIERRIGECGVHDPEGLSPTGKYDALELLRECQAWGAVCIAAHVAAEAGGALRVLRGQPRINVWRDESFLACSLPGTASAAPDELRPILENKNPEHRRKRPVAILNAQDVSGPDDLRKASGVCFIKMSDVSIDGLRQALLDPDSRIRLLTDPVPEQHAELVAIGWQGGGFLDGVGIHWNENLNVLIGGRGAGKSTIIESLRYVLHLDPLGDEAQKNHEAIIRHVLRSGTKIMLLVRSYRPNQQDYLIERTIPNPAIIRDASGNVLPLTPQDLLPRVEVYGQHEIGELAKSPEKRTHLLARFKDRDDDADMRMTETRRELQRSRSQLQQMRAELARLEERLASAPLVEQTLKRYQDAGLETRLRDQSLLVREERVLKTAGERVQPYRETLAQLRENTPIDRAFVSEAALKDLPGGPILQALDGILADTEHRMVTILTDLSKAIDDFDIRVAGVKNQWGERKRTAQAEYERILRDLQKSKIDGEEFLRLRRQLEEFRPLRDQRTLLEDRIKEVSQRRLNLIAEWEDLKQAEFQRLQRAAKKVSRQLANRVRVQVSFEGNREPLLSMLKERVGGWLSDTLDILRQREHLSLRELVEACRKGKEDLIRRFSLPPAQADRLAQTDDGVLMEIEEIVLPSNTTLELNVAQEEQPENWKALDALSTGQKATAVLMLLLLDSEAPLVVDQPEDDLDNRFVTDGVVPKMRQEKRRRQFLFATHNANIPVLGDAELIIGLSAAGEADHGSASVRPEHLGSLDSKPVRELVEELLEGGRDAFEMRRLKYGF